MTHTAERALTGFVRAPLLPVLLVVALVGCRERRKLELPDPEQTAAAAQTVRTDAERGERLFRQHGCTACHTIHGAPLVGPPLDGLAGRTRRLASGVEVVADEDYLRESLYAPSAKRAEGFDDVMPAYGDSLRDDEIDAIIDYLLLLGR